jgi:protein TonB
MNVMRSALRCLVTGSCGIATVAVVFLGLTEMTRSEGELALPIATARKVHFTRLQRDTETEVKPRTKIEEPGTIELPPPAKIDGPSCIDCGNPIKLVPAVHLAPVSHGRPRTDLLVGGTEGDPQPIVRILPAYPANGHGDGWVLVQFDITRIGSVANARVVDASPRGMFEKNALKAIERWRYRPAVMDGQAVERRGLRVRLNFVLERA